MSNKPRRETRRSQILRVFTENGSTFDGMSQSVIMEEIMLNFIIDEDRAARCADFLIARFGTVKRVLSATIDEICEGGVVTEKRGGRHTSGERIHDACAVRALQKPIKFDDLNTLTDYLKALYSLECREKLYMFSVDKKGFLKHRRLISEGTYSNVQVDFGQISKFMFNEPSGRFIITHNHPNASCTPSSGDISSTAYIKNRALELGGEMAAHYIIGADGITRVPEEFNYAEFLFNRDKWKE